jgi:hypothetical protein
MWKIVPSLYLGTKEDSENIAALESAGVTHVVNCAIELPCLFEGVFDYLWLSLKDPDEKFVRQLPKAFSFIDSGRKSGSVLVHCAGGISRSPAIVLAYLCHSGCGLDEAAATIQQVVRTRPNVVFLNQLRDYFGLSASDEDIAMLLQELGSS